MKQKKILLAGGFVLLLVLIIGSMNTAANTNAVEKMKDDELDPATPPTPTPANMGIRVGEPVGQARAGSVTVQQAQDPRIAGAVMPVMFDANWFPGMADNVILAGPTIVKQQSVV